MQKRSSTPSPPEDENEAAFRVLQIVTERKKDPAAVSLGRRGGLKGGRARADKLSAEERRRIAVLAANARWEKPHKK